MTNHQLVPAIARRFSQGLAYLSIAAIAAMSGSVFAAEPEASVPAGKYSLDKGHGYITFSYSHLGFSNPHVGFNDFDVDLQFDPEKPAASQLEVVIQAASISSRVEVFDGHLRGGDYFDTDKHPTIGFTSTKVAMTSETTADVYGDLTIKGVSKPVILNAVLNKAGTHPIAKKPTLGLSATTTVKRSDWGIDKYTPLVGDEVTIEIEVELPQAL